MGKVIELEEYRFKSDGRSVKDIRRIRAYVRWKVNNHRLMQEADEKRKEMEQSKE